MSCLINEISSLTYNFGMLKKHVNTTSRFYLSFVLKTKRFALSNYLQIKTNLPASLFLEPANKNLNFHCIPTKNHNFVVIQSALKSTGYL